MNPAQIDLHVSRTGHPLETCSHVEWSKELSLFTGAWIRSKFSSARVQSRAEDHLTPYATRDWNHGPRESVEGRDFGFPYVEE